MAPVAVEKYKNFFILLVLPASFVVLHFVSRFLHNTIITNSLSSRQQRGVKNQGILVLRMCTCNKYFIEIHS